MHSVCGPLSVRSGTRSFFAVLHHYGLPDLELLRARSSGSAPITDRRACRASRHVDPTLTKADVEKHVKDFGYSSVPSVLDTTQKLARQAGATITPEAAIIGPTGAVLYRGRIDNVYAALGKRRPEATEHDVRKALDELLSGKQASEPRTQAIGCYIPSIVVKPGVKQ